MTVNRFFINHVHFRIRDVLGLVILLALRTVVMCNRLLSVVVNPQYGRHRRLLASVGKWL